MGMFSRRHEAPPVPIPPVTGNCPDCGLRMQSHPPERLSGSHPALCMVAKTRVICPDVDAEPEVENFPECR